MRKEKELLLDEIKQKIDASTAMIVTKYDRLEPNTSWTLRSLLAKTGGTLEVVRKKVFMKAAEKSNIALDETLLGGHVGVVFIAQPDAMPSAKVVFKFSEENGNMLEVLCGLLDGKMVLGKDVEYLSKLPGMDEMRAIFLGLLTSPMSQTLSVMEAFLAGPISVIEQKS